MRKMLILLAVTAGLAVSPAAFAAALSPQAAQNMMIYQYNYARQYQAQKHIGNVYNAYRGPGVFIGPGPGVYPAYPPGYYPGPYYPGPYYPGPYYPQPYYPGPVITIPLP